MLKTILRTSLLIAPLLSADILKATNDESVERPPIKKLTLFSYQPDNLDLCDENWGVVKADDKDSFRQLSVDLLRYMMSGLSLKDQINLSQTSRYWRVIASHVNRANINNWNDKHEARQLTLLNPRSLFSLADKVARDVPLRVVDYSPIDDTLTPQPAADPNPAHVQAFVDQVAANRQLSVTLARRTLGMDPCLHFREVLLMAAIVGKSKVLKDYLEITHWEYYEAYLMKVSKDQYEHMTASDKEQYRIGHPMTFGEKDVYVQELLTNANELRRILMAVKLIALNPEADDDVHEHLDILDAFARTHYSQSLADVVKKVLRVKPDQPFWACYADNLKVVADFSFMCEKANMMEEGHQSLVGVERFTDYADALFKGNPQIDLVKLHYARQGIGFSQGNLKQAMECEVEMMKRFNPNNIINYFDSWHSIAATEKFRLILSKDEGVLGRYNQLMELTTKFTSKPEAEGGPSALQAAALKRFQAESIIMFRDVTLFPMLDQLLSGMTDVFAGTKEDRIAVDYTFESMKDYIPLRREKHNMMLFASALVQNNWADACQLVKNVKDFNPALLIAVKMKMNNPEFPAELIVPIGRILAAGWTNIHKQGNITNLGIKAFYRYIHDEAFVEKFLNWRHPFVRRWVETLKTDGDTEE